MRVRYKLCLIAAFFFFSFFILLYNAGTFLCIESPKCNAKAIVVLMGEYDRLTHVVNLIKTKRATSIIFAESIPLDQINNDSSVNAVYFAIFRSFGIQDSMVTMIHKPAMNTTDELHLVSKYLADRPQIDSIIIVTSQYHLRRVSLIAKTIFARNGLNIQYTFSYPPKQKFDIKYWWKTAVGRKSVFSEYAKIIYFYTIDQFKPRN